MSLKISGDEITLTRGDSAEIEINLTNGDEPYVLEDGATLTFCLKKSANDKTPLVKKEIIDSVLVIDHTDTSELTFGSYVYDIQIITSDGKHYTPIGPASFVLSKEVNYE